MGVGKSTVGPIVARRLGLPFVDLDAAIVARTGRSIPALFAAEGEGAFRAAESAALSDALATPPLVIALGGGTLHQPACRLLLAEHVVVVLQAPLEALAPRLAGTGRPLAGRATELYQQRAAGYAAHPQVDVVGRSPEAVAGAVVALWEAA